MQLTPAEFRTQNSLSAGQFKRLKAKVSQANPETSLTVQDGNQWFLTESGLDLLTAALPTSRDQSQRPVTDQRATSTLTRRQPAEIIEAELVPEVAELQIVLPDFSSTIDRAQLEIANTAQISSGNRNLRRTLRRKAMVEAATAEAVEDFALADKAYEATLAQLEQQQLNQLGIGATAPTQTPAEVPTASVKPAKK